MLSRYHRRFAVRQHVTLSGGLRGLLFELTQQGCRVSNLENSRFSPDESVRIFIPGFGELEGRVRVAGDGAIALRYQRPLHLAVLDRLLSICRGADQGGDTASLGAA